MTVQALVDQFQDLSQVQGPGLVNGQSLQQLLNVLFSSEKAITAFAGGGQTGARPLTATYNSVDTVATASDSVMLKQALPGAVQIIYNNTATLLAIFGRPSNPNTGVGDTIASSASNTQQATATGITLATTLTAIFICFTAGQWKEFLTA